MSEETLRLAAYCRVSREKPKRKETAEEKTEPETTIENQIEQIKAYAERSGRIIDDWFIDELVSGDADHRPSFEEMFARIHEFDGIVARDVDRFGRETIDVLQAEKDLRKLGKHLVILDFEGMNIDTSTATGKLLFTIVAAVAQHEKGKTLERMRIGREEYIRAGGKLGRKPYTVPETMSKELFEVLLKRKVSFAKIAEIFNENSDKKWDWRTVKALAKREGFEKYLVQYTKSPMSA